MSFAPNVIGGPPTGINGTGVGPSSIASAYNLSANYAATGGARSIGLLAPATLAREHGVHANSLPQWKVLYRAGKLDAQLKSLDAQLKSVERVAGPTASTTFVPVNVVQPMRRPQPTTRHDAIGNVNAPGLR